MEILDGVVEGSGKGVEFRKEFKKYVSRQDDLAEISEEFPYPRLSALWEIVKMEQPDFILNMSNPHTYLLLPEIKKQFPDIKTLDLIHNEEFHDTGWFGAAMHFQKYIDTRTVTSDFWKDVLIQKYNEPAEKVSVVFNKLDYELFSFNPNTRQLLRNTYKIKPDVKVIGFMGRLETQKQPEVFAEVAKLLVHRDDLQFVMIGDGSKLAEMADDIKRTPNLMHLPSTKVPEKMLQLFDVAVFPSLYEGYPMIGLECAAMNIPIIVPNIVGFREQIENGNFGAYYPPKGIIEDAEAIAGLIESQLDDIIAKGKNGRDFILKYHEESELDRQIISLFE